MEKTRMKLTNKFLKVAVAAIALALGATSTLAGAKIFVIGGKADDPFWSRVKKGAEDAGLVAAAQGGSVTWLGPQNYDNLGKDAADLIRTAIAQHADAIVGPDWVPEAMDEAFKAVVAAKILYGALDEMVTNWVLSKKAYPLPPMAGEVLSVFFGGMLSK